VECGNRIDWGTRLDDAISHETTMNVRGYMGTVAGVGLWWFTELLGWTGALLVLYTLITWATNEPWPVVERHAPFISSLLTLIGTALTAASVYFHSSKVRTPWRHSKYVASPIVIISSVAAIAILLVSGKLSQVSVSGFGMLAIAGGLKRLLTYPVESSEAQKGATG
jgi:predicted membrane channel-forming protein YqfA (hemolysin III family)